MRSATSNGLNLSGSGALASRRLARRASRRRGYQRMLGGLRVGGARPFGFVQGRLSWGQPPNRRDASASKTTASRPERLQTPGSLHPRH